MTRPPAEKGKTSPSFDIRPLVAEDIPRAHALSSGLGWPHRLEDWQLFFEVGCGTVACDSAGTVIGTAMAFPYGDEIASIGSIIVSPSHQRLGIGRRLMEAIAPSSDHREFRLVATPDGAALYAALGFTPVATIAQHQGVAAPKSPPPPPGSAVARVMRAQDRGAIIALDADAHGAERDVLKLLLARGVEGTVVEAEDRLAGFALRHRFGLGHVIGPIVARTEADAIALVSPHLDAHRGTFLRIDAPHDAGAFRQIIDAAGLVPVGSGSAMTRRPIARPSTDVRIYGLVTQAIG